MMAAQLCVNAYRTHRADRELLRRQPTVTGREVTRFFEMN